MAKSPRSQKCAEICPKNIPGEILWLLIYRAGCSHRRGSSYTPSSGEFRAFLLLLFSSFFFLAVPPHCDHAAIEATDNKGRTANDAMG